MSLIKMPVMVLLSAIVFLISFPASSDSSGVVLALSGGGLRGLAHVGVIKVLSDNDIPIVGIVGTSMGALVGGLTAIGYSTDQIIEIVTDIDITASLAEHSGRVFVPVDAHYDVNVPSGYWLRRTRTGDQLGPLGFFSAAKLYEKFTNLASKVEVVDFMNLPIPFAAIATDIETGEKVVLRAGSIASAMRASIAIPGLFEPWRIGDRLLVDGGLVSNLPVLTAKEIFSGFPIVAVDVTDKLERSNRVGSIVDVLDRSITIMTHQNVLEERKYADVIITPEVYGFGIFDESKKEAIIEEGIKAANEKLEIIKSILRFSPERKLIRVDDTNDVLVKDVVVTGLSMEASALIREKYLHWIWKPADAKAIIAASKEIADRSDILAADYHIINEDGLVVYFEVVPLPDTEWGVSGYTTNIDPYRSIYLRGTFRNLISERDSLHGLLKIGEEWGIDLNYRTDPSPMNHWEFRYSLQHLNFEPVNSANKNWRRHGFGVSHWFDFGNLDIGLGYAYEYIDGTGGSNNSSGPVFSLSLNTLDVPSDPTKGSALTLYAWWADFDQVLFRVDYFQPLKISNVWRAYLRLGFAEGNYNEIGQATYLGSAEELLSVAANPIEAERIAWANIAFRRVISRSVLGTITGEIFAGIGYA
ncbi:MAG: patatin-like phospholipase family protein, partial [Synergistaceae bacterium]|nr:patatin-like phospholipase family protein [Synergistaceae bacterium]